MKILWQNEHYPDVTKGGGGAVNTFYIVRAMLAQGHNALILSQGGDWSTVTREDVNGTPVLRVPKPSMLDLLWPFWPFLGSYYLKDMVLGLCNEFEGYVAIDSPYALAFKRYYPIRRLVYRIEATVRSHAVAVPESDGRLGQSTKKLKEKAIQGWMTWENEVVEQLAWRAADALVVKSAFMRDELISLYKFGQPDKVHIIPNGVDHARYAEAKVSDAVLEQIKRGTKHRIVIVYCGRLVRMKNVEFLLRAFSKLVKKNQCLLVILGDGEERDNLEKAAAQLGIAEDVRFIGKTNYVEEFFAAGDVFVFPSTYEPFGNALVEAMAAGLPAVVLKPDGVSIRTASAEIIEDGFSGFLVQPDVAQFAKCLDRLVDDQDLRASIGKRGQSIARQRFDWAKCAAEYVRLLGSR